LIVKHSSSLILQPICSERPSEMFLECSLFCKNLAELHENVNSTLTDYPTKGHGWSPKLKMKCKKLSPNLDGLQQDDSIIFGLYSMNGNVLDTKIEDGSF